MAHLREARSAVEMLHGCGAVLCSPVYETEPVDCEPGTATYLNTVVEIEYDGQPVVLLAALQKIEAQLGRPSKRPRNAPRTMDLDILYMGNLTLSNEVIVIPHPRLHLRRFVLEPLAAIRPDLILPGQEASVSQLCAQLAPEPVVTLYAAKW